MDMPCATLRKTTGKSLAEIYIWNKRAKTSEIFVVLQNKDSRRRGKLKCSVLWVVARVTWHHVGFHSKALDRFSRWTSADNMGSSHPTRTFSCSNSRSYWSLVALSKGTTWELQQLGTYTSRIGCSSRLDLLERPLVPWYPVPLSTSGAVGPLCYLLICSTYWAVELSQCICLNIGYFTSDALS